jgi:hypothetical protein
VCRDLERRNGARPLLEEEVHVEGETDEAARRINVTAEGSMA